MLPNLGYGELLIILVVALLVFGAKQVPEVARSFGRAINAFKAGMREPPDDEPERRSASEDRKPGAE